MSLLSYVDIYCERTEIGILGEPLNAISNMAFFAAAAYLFLFYRDHYHKDRQIAVLIALIALIGVGSSLFHLFSNTLTMLADVFSIVLFVVYYLWVALQRFLHWPRMKAAAAIAGIIALALLAEAIPSPFNLNHSATYLPCLAAIVYIGLRLKTTRHESAETLFLAAAWFSFSLFFRIIDVAMCDILFTGTHFLWHICNGIVLVLLVRPVIEHPPLTLR